MKKVMNTRFFALVSALLLLTGCAAQEIPAPSPAPSTPVQSTPSASSAPTQSDAAAEDFSLSLVADYSGEPYVVVHDNIPYFRESDLTANSYESYSALDELGRCGVTMASIGVDLMPTEERGSISQVKPTGWQTVKYDSVDGKYLYNRCHLIGFQLTGENANEQNLITGTRAMNVDGMLPFENLVADYVKETENHVLYRVTPIFVEDELVARGVLMEGQSVEDDGEGVLFCVYAYNNQPGIEIDYATGNSYESGAVGAAGAVGDADTDSADAQTYVLNASSKKFHLPTCSGAQDMKAENRSEYNGTREELIAAGYDPCGRCKP